MGKEVGSDVLKGRGRISSFFPFVPCHSVTAGEPVFLPTSTSLCLLSHVLCLRLWPTFISCFPPVLPLSPFTPSKPIAFRPVVRLASTAFYFGLYLWMRGGGSSWAESWEQRRKVWASGPSATCDVLSRPAVLGPTRGGKGGGSHSGSGSARAPQLHNCKHRSDLGERVCSALGCSRDRCSSCRSSYSWIENLIIGGVWTLIPSVAWCGFEQGSGLHVLKMLLTCW